MKPKIELGTYQELVVAKKTDFGVYLSAPGGDGAEKILLPKAQVPEGTELKDVIRVFVYKDSEDRPIATTLEPAITLGGVARLVVKQITPIGAFLEWGLPKDLFLPFKEQLYEVKQGDAVLVTLYLDKSARLCASMHVYPVLRNDSDYEKGDQVSGRVYEISNHFGVFVAVDDLYSALIPQKDVFETYQINQLIQARVAQVLEDGRLTLSTKKKIPEQMNEDAAFIYDCLIQENGFLPYHDKSSPDAIKKRFHMSKNAFKRSIGHLLKEGKITISSDGIRRVVS